MDTEMIVVWSCSIIAVTSIIGLLINRIKEGKGIGIRAIQFAIVTVMFPILIILTMVDVLPSSIVAVVTGTIIGYAFAKTD
ncbi:MAG: hypothetical protein ACI8SE_001651 [Bacteroidia bacterium]|jgi:hypothetical protein